MQRVSPWAKMLSDGRYAFCVRAGGKPIEFEPGKNAVVVGSVKELPALIELVRSGELDTQLMANKLLIQRKPPQAKAQAPQGKRKAA